MDKKVNSVGEFEAGYNCAQAVLGIFCDRYNLDKVMAMKVASGFGGGINSMGETCGAVTGAVMALGLIYGRSDADDPAKKEMLLEKINQYMEEFRHKHSFIKCKDLLQQDTSTEEGRDKADQLGLYKSACPLFIMDSVEIIEELIKR